MSRSSHYYLSKNGKTSGPFTADDIAKLKASGAYEEYAWVWEPGAKSWRATGTTSAGFELPPKPPAFNAPARPLQAICHDNKTISSGEIRVEKERVYFTTDAAAQFRVGQRVILNLLDEAGGRSENVEATILSSARNAERWELELKWAKAPGLLSLS